jgi:UDP-N-acetylglucosamine 4,6-dehydratase
MNSILITGGAGYFGKALVKNLLLGNTGRICIYSRDEHKHALMEREFGENERTRYFVGCVRDKDRLRRAMDGVDVVVHAAALKRIQTGFYNPTEMVRTNVVGTINVIEAATEAGVKKVVGLSSDKAFSPVSAYGHSKAMSESLILAANNTRGVRGPLFACVRYGNVIGSTGSVLPVWTQILKHSDTVPVSDPDVTRFWMTVEEAVDLVLSTIETMKGGELKIPELPAFRLGDLAEAMGAKMKIIGLGVFEKKHESMDSMISSDTARRMTVDEIREGLGRIH